MTCEMCVLVVSARVGGGGGGLGCVCMAKAVILSFALLIFYNRYISTFENSTYENKYDVLISHHSAILQLKYGSALSTGSRNYYI